MSKTTKVLLITVAQLVFALALGFFLGGLHLSIAKIILFAVLGNIPITMVANWARNRVMDCDDQSCLRR